MATYTRNQRRRKMLMEQRILGLILILASAVLLALALTGKTYADRDCTAVFFTVPIGMLLLLSKKVLIV